MVFSSDDSPYGGWERISKEVEYETSDTEFGEGIKVYLPCRTALALEKIG